MDNEVKIPMTVVKKEYICPVCMGGYMKQTGTLFLTNPPIYEHTCENCGQTQEFKKQYPSIEYEEDIENEDNYNHLKIAEILDKYLPPDGVGTEREKLRMNLYRELLCILKERS